MTFLVGLLVIGMLFGAKTARTVLGAVILFLVVSTGVLVLISALP